MALYVAISLNIFDKYEVFKKGIVSDYKVKTIGNIKRWNKLYAWVWYWCRCGREWPRNILN